MTRPRRTCPVCVREWGGGLGARQRRQISRDTRLRTRRRLTINGRGRLVGRKMFTSRVCVCGIRSGKRFTLGRCRRWDTRRRMRTSPIVMRVRGSGGGPYFKTRPKSYFPLLLTTTIRPFREGDATFSLFALVTCPPGPGPGRG